MCVHMFNKKKLACLCAHVYMSVYSLTAEGFSFQKAISEKNKFVSSSYRLRWCSHGKKKVKGERSSANTWINEVSYELSLLVPYVRVREGLANTSPVAGEQKGTSPNQEIMHSQWYNNGLTQTDRQTDQPLPLLHLSCPPFLSSISSASSLHDSADPVSIASHGTSLPSLTAPLWEMQRHELLGAAAFCSTRETINITRCFFFFSFFPTLEWENAWKVVHLMVRGRTMIKGK